MRLLLRLQALPQLLQPLSDATVGLAYALRLQQLPPSTADESSARIAFVAQSLLPAADEACPSHQSRPQPCSKPVCWLHEGCQSCLHGARAIACRPSHPHPHAARAARHTVLGALLIMLSYSRALQLVPDHAISPVTAVAASAVHRMLLCRGRC